jgi:hypothetical protein
MEVCPGSTTITLQEERFRIQLKLPASSKAGCADTAVGARVATKNKNKETSNAI